jgi:hypothetical protein
MRRDYIAKLYDDEYAATYEAKFMHSDLTRADTQHELTLLGQFLSDGRSWLDVECCTGFWLRNFPAVERAGIEISPAMCRRATEGNPGVTILLHDFRDPLPAWRGRWGLVSCMWYGYGLVDTLEQLELVIHNLWSLTAADGTCFVPLADPFLMTGVDLPYRVDWDETSHAQITGIVWSFVEEGGNKVHLNQIAPKLEYMVAQFEIYFESVELIRYPPAFEGWHGRPALVATGKKSLSG